MVEGESEKKRDCCSLDDLAGVVRLQNLQLKVELHSRAVHSIASWRPCIGTLWWVSGTWRNVYCRTITSQSVWARQKVQSSEEPKWCASSENWCERAPKSQRTPLLLRVVWHPTAWWWVLMAEHYWFLWINMCWFLNNHGHLLFLLKRAMVALGPWIYSSLGQKRPQHLPDWSSHPSLGHWGKFLSLNRSI